ncbi:hypothetical protein FRC12_009487 [Ceratobasidium sp. 428]|nr:hypothetical protein FRC12_009487 [Ceratobasidium sp. 428]
MTPNNSFAEWYQAMLNFLIHNIDNLESAALNMPTQEPHTLQAPNLGQGFVVGALSEVAASPNGILNNAAQTEPPVDPPKSIQMPEPQHGTGFIYNVSHLPGMMGTVDFDAATGLSDSDATVPMPSPVPAPANIISRPTPTVAGADIIAYHPCDNYGSPSDHHAYYSSEPKDARSSPKKRSWIRRRIDDFKYTMGQVTVSTYYNRVLTV